LTRSKRSCSCTRHLLVRLARIIAARNTTGGAVNAAQQRRQHRAGVQQVSDQAQRLRLLLPGRLLEIGPLGRDQRLRAIRQHQRQLQPALSALPAQHLQRLALQRVVAAGDRDRRREAVEMGSVS
jgi:hypothetical protein